MENAHPETEVPTLTSIAQRYIDSREPLTVTVGGKPQEVVVQPWHVAAIRAKAGLPANKELDEERFRQLLQDVLGITIGGKPEPEPAK